MQLNCHKFFDLNHGANTTKVLPGQVLVYARKSVATEAAQRSIDEQVDHAVSLCDRLGIPLRDCDIIREKIGLGGDHFWDGAGRVTQIDIDGSPRAPRPGLTELVDRVENGTIRLVMVWDDSRLWRSTAVCGQLADIFARRGTFVMDRNGTVLDLQGATSRQLVSILAASAQQFRELTIANINRTFQAKLEKGEPRTTKRCLGFAPAGNGKVTLIPEELALVRRIFRMYAYGENGSAPMSASRIAIVLRAEELDALFPTLIPADSGPRAFLADVTISRILRNPRYIAKQRDKKSGCLYDNLSYLVDKEPLISHDLWLLVQDRLARSANTSPRSVNTNSLSTIIRCGTCGLSYTLMTGGLPKWGPRGGRSTFRRCSDRPFPILCSEFDDYLSKHLFPLLAAELRDRRRSGSALEASNLVKELEFKRQTKERELRGAMKAAFENLSSESKLYASLHQELTDFLSQIDSEILLAKEVALYSEDQVESLLNAALSDPDTVRQAARAVLRWAAVIPLHRPKEPARVVYANGQVGNYLVRAKESGYVLFLTKWGTYHTATVEWVFKERGQRFKVRHYALRPASSDEEIMDVMGLPDPRRFVVNLFLQFTRTGKCKFSLAEWAPGYRGPEPSEWAKVLGRISI